MYKYTSVDEYLSGLDDDRKSLVEELRKYILAEAPYLTERIKWNAPSYIKDGEDRITFNTMNKEQVVKLVFHMGATKKEDKKAQPILKDAYLVEWVSDIRGYMTFNSLEDVYSHEDEIKRTIREWMSLS